MPARPWTVHNYQCIKQDLTLQTARLVWRRGRWWSPLECLRSLCLSCQLWLKLLIFDPVTVWRMHTTNCIHRHRQVTAQHSSCDLKHMSPRQHRNSFSRSIQYVELNPVEHLWRDLKKSVHLYHCQPEWMGNLSWFTLMLRRIGKTSKDGCWIITPQYPRN